MSGDGFRPGRPERRRRLSRRHGRRRAGSPAWASLRTRRRLAAVALLLLLGLAWGAHQLGIQWHLDDARLAATAPRHTAVIGGEGSDYHVTVGGLPYWLDHARNVPGGPGPGRTAVVVLDPWDDTRAIAVGTGADWVRDPVAEGLALAALLAGGAAGGVWAAWLLLPEDRARMPALLPRPRAAWPAAGRPERPQRVVVRRIVVAVVGAALFALAFAAVADDRRLEQADARLAATGQRTTATVAAVEHDRGRTVRYTVRAGGRLVLLDTGWFEEELEVGDRVRVVLDPNDPGRVLLAGGGPERWAAGPFGRAFMDLLFPSLAAATTAWIARHVLADQDKRRIARFLGPRGRRDRGSG